VYVTNPTPEQIAEWKKQHGDLFKLKVAVEGNKQPLIGITKKPDKTVLAAAMVYLQSDPLKAGDVMRANCLLGGDADLLTSDENIVAVNTAIGKLFVVPTVDVEKI
jgi:hypothetical protein